MMHCPECQSDDVECVSTTKSHTHRCKSCGYELVAAPREALREVET